MRITSIAQQKNNIKLYSIFIDYNYTFSMEDVDVAVLGLKEGQEITKDKIEYYKQIYELGRAKEKALKYLSYKMRSFKEVERKLKDLGYNDDVINKTMDKLIELNYINDENYAQAYVKEKCKLRPCGKKLLQLELKQKGIDANTIENIIDTSQIDEYQNAYKLAEKKASSIDIHDRKELSKIYNMLIRKGFSYDTATAVIKNIENNL